MKAPTPSPDTAVPSRIPEGRLFPNGDPGYSIVESQKTRQEQWPSSWFSERLRKRSGARLSLKKFLPLQTPRLCPWSFSEPHQPSQDRNTADATRTSFRKEHTLWNLPSGSGEGRPFLLVKRCGFFKCLQTDCFNLAVITARREEQGRGLSKGDLSLHTAILYKIWSSFDIIDQLFWVVIHNY